MLRSLSLVLAEPSPGLRARLAVLATCAAMLFFMLGTRPDASAMVPPAPYDKLAHMLVFGGFAGIAWLVGAGRSFLLPVVVALVLGCTDELLQSFTPGRDADWHDIVADVAGALLVVGLLQLVRWSGLAISRKA